MKGWVLALLLVGLISAATLFAIDGSWMASAQFTAAAAGVLVADRLILQWRQLNLLRNDRLAAVKRVVQESYDNDATVVGLHILQPLLSDTYVDQAANRAAQRQEQMWVQRYNRGDASDF